MEIPVYTVDAFTNLPFKGNPAAVCLLENVSNLVFLHNRKNSQTTVYVGSSIYYAMFIMYPGTERGALSENSS